MARKESKKKKKQKHKKSSHKKDKRRQNESFEDVSSESSSDLTTSSSSDSSSESEGEENSALTKAKAMLKFRETFQKRLEQRERAAGKSKSNVKELFDSSVPLDIEDLKAEFDNAPVPSLDNDDILRGGQESKGRKSSKVQDFSKITIGKLPSKGFSAKSKPEKLVNQFFAKELVNPKPKPSIKIGLISSKIKASVPEPSLVSLAPGLETCPVTPPDGYSMRTREEEDEESAPVPEKEKPAHAGVKKSAPRIIHQISEPDPVPSPTPMDHSDLHPTQETQPDEEGGYDEEQMEEVDVTGVGCVEPTYTGPGPAPLPPANYCGAPVKIDPSEQMSTLVDNQEFPPASQHGAPAVLYNQAPQHGAPAVPYNQASQHGATAVPYSQAPQHGAPAVLYSQAPQHGPPAAPYSQAPQHGAPAITYSQAPQHGAPAVAYSQAPQHGAPAVPYSQASQHGAPAVAYSQASQHGAPAVAYSQAPSGVPPHYSMPPNGVPAAIPPSFQPGALAQQMMNHNQAGPPPSQLPGALTHRGVAPEAHQQTASDQQPPGDGSVAETSKSNDTPTYDPNKPSRFDKPPPGFDPNKMPPGFDPSRMPPGFDPSRMPPGFDPSRMPPGFDPSKMPPFDPSKMMPFDPSKMPPGFDPTKMPPGFDPTKMPPFPLPPGVRPGTFPPGQRPPFDHTRFPVPIPGRPPFDPALLRAGIPPPMFRPPHIPYPSDHRRSHHDRDRDHERDREHRDRHHESRRSSSYDHHSDGHRTSSGHDSHHRSTTYDRSSYEERRSSPYKHDRQSSPYDPNRKSQPPVLHNGHHPTPHITAAQWSHETKPEDLKAESPPTPEIDPRAVREALRFLQGSNDVDDDVVRKALMSIKSKQKSEKEQQKSYSAAPTQYNYPKPTEHVSPRSPEIQPHEAEKIVQQVQEQERLAQQQQMHSSMADAKQVEEVGEVLAEDEANHAAGPEIPVSGLPEPDYTLAADLDKSTWQIAPSKGTGEDTAPGYTFPPEQVKEYDYSDYYMHYYQQAYHMWTEEKEKPVEARYPVSQGYGHKRALEKGGAVKGSGRAILFNKEEIQALVLKRKKIAQDMVKNPESSELMDKMEAVQHKLNECGVTETEIAMMETSQMQSAWKKRRQEDSDCPAWAIPDMFYGLPTVRSTVGMAILKKQGWVAGQVLGRGCPYGSAFGAGSLQPLEFMVKTDQAGLLCAEERAALKAKKYGEVMPTVTTEALPAPRTTLSGRHPIAALADYCHQEKWKQPEYTLLKEEGLAHKKLYFFQVSVKCGKFTTPAGARNKRQGKSDVAAACLERLGLMTSLPPGYS